MGVAVGVSVVVGVRLGVSVLVGVPVVLGGVDVFVGVGGGSVAGKQPARVIDKMMTDIVSCLIIQTGKRKVNFQVVLLTTKESFNLHSLSNASDRTVTCYRYINFYPSPQLNSVLLFAKQVVLSQSATTQNSR